MKMHFLRTISLALPAAVFLTAPVVPTSAKASITAYKQAVAESISRDAEIAAFYRARSFEPIWTGASPDNKARRQALLDALSQAHLHGLPAARYNPQTLLDKLAKVTHTRDKGLMEVALSELYLDFAQDLQTGQLDPRKASSGIKREAPLRDRTALLQQLVDQDPARVMQSLAPQTPEYARLMKEKMQLESRLASGGWGPAVRANSLKPGATGQAVVDLRNRLMSMGYLGRTLSASYDSDMEKAVLAFQMDHGLTEDGIANAATLREINRTVAERLRSVLVAMERERWTNFPDGRGERHILVNLTDFKARIIDDGKVTFETRSVIGHQDPDRRTPEFSDVMDHMVINPSWYVPRSIIVKEYLPRLRANPGAVGHLQVIDGRGRVVSRGNGFSQYSARSFPFSMRQPPGPRNALGTVKFMFPNKYNIYLHDTPKKSLFSHEVRTYSHGCVRLNDPHEFAYALLAKQEAAPVDFFQTRLRSGRETRVELEAPVPVHLIYRTAYTTAKGKTQYRRDVYGRDAKIWNALAAQGVVLGRPDS